MQCTMYDKRDDFTFLIVNFSFISSNIPASPAYGVYTSQLIRQSRACAQYSDFLDKTQLLTQKIFKQAHVAPRLKSSLQKVYDHHNLVNRYEISISPMTMTMAMTMTISMTMTMTMTMDLLLFCRCFLYHCRDFYRT